MKQTIRWHHRWEASGGKMWKCRHCSLEVGSTDGKAPTRNNATIAGVRAIRMPGCAQPKQMRVRKSVNVREMLFYCADTLGWERVKSFLGLNDRFRLRPDQEVSLMRLHAAINACLLGADAEIALVKTWTSRGAL